MNNRNPWEKMFRQNNQGSKVFGAASASSAQEQIVRRETNMVPPVPTEFPRHLYPPYGAKTVDMRDLVSVGPLSTADILTWTARPGEYIQFIGYAVFNDGLDFTLLEFVPTINGNRIFGYQGRPDNASGTFKIALGVAPDLSDNSVIKAQQLLKPGETLNWRLINNDVVPVAMGVRMVGYFVAPDYVRDTNTTG